MAYDTKKLSGLLHWSRRSGSNFDMRYWVAKEPCGTVMCLAGKTILDAGYSVDWEAINAGDNGIRICEKDGTPWSIQDAARFELGLKEKEADQLFTPDLHDQVREAIEDDQFPDTGKIQDMESRMAFDFLCYLVARARHRRANLSGPEVAMWAESWALVHDESLSEAYLRE